MSELGPAYIQASDFWLRRVGIILQLGRRQMTDQAYLTTAILTNRTDDEFFIQKAIGRALRDYSKTNPAWVTQFIASHVLSPLAMREGSKYLTNKKDR
ncbi:hypothetical protein C5Z26_03085 [Lactobacillus sp. CBA3606]|uniref:DNA alkylation repair protein n=1 Tax=Lactobacillus sp. CBA3606 TaxID=2099789 RepID=UPI000CFD6E9D|nr:hypothetical protein C5Z26_03085 [Lactobacillus sp. CBA3606]